MWTGWLDQARVQAVSTRAEVENMDADWPDLKSELDRWAAEGRVASLWWRDDDATAMTPPLRRALALSRRYRVPIHLAVIPAPMDRGFGGDLAGEPHVRVLQHGYAHANHAPDDGPHWELGDHRPLDLVVQELIAGQAILKPAMQERLLPVLVPPWNRISPAVIARIGDSGNRALSTHGKRRARFTDTGIEIINTHCDPIDWDAQARFLGRNESLRDLVHHLTARRAGKADSDEASGLCTHHSRQDEETWAFVERLLAETSAHPAARWMDLRAVLQDPAHDHTQQGS